MITKSTGKGGNLLAYFKSKKDKMGKLREQAAVRLWGNPELTQNLLDLQAPPFVGEEAGPRRMTVHLQGSLSHLMVGCSERQEVVEPWLLQICEHVMDLNLAGLQRTSLPFVWYKHAQKIGTHAHGARGHSLLPFGGPYEPPLKAALLQRHDRLVSRAMGLSDPLDPARALLVMSGWASWKEDKIPLIKKIICTTQRLWAEGKIKKHGDLENVVLKELNYEVLASPDKGGRPVPRASQASNPRLPQYPNCVTVRAEGEIIVLRGPLCRPSFQGARWQRSLDRRQREVDQLRNSPSALYQEFNPLLSAYIQEQRARLEWISSPEDVTEKDFEWLVSLIVMEPLDSKMPELAEDPLIAYPALYYPYFGDDAEIAWELTDPRIATGKIVLDPRRPELEPDGDLFWPGQVLPVQALRQPPSPPPLADIVSDAPAPRLLAPSGPGPSNSTGQEAKAPPAALVVPPAPRLPSTLALRANSTGAEKDKLKQRRTLQQERDQVVLETQWEAELARSEPQSLQEARVVIPAPDLPPTEAIRPGGDEPALPGEHSPAPDFGMS